MVIVVLVALGIGNEEGARGEIGEDTNGTGRVYVEKGERG